MENKEIVINVKDLFAEYIRKLWLIIICAVLFTVLFTGYKYYKDKNEIQSGLNAENFEWKEDSFTPEEMDAIDNYVYLMQQYQIKNEYQENSIYMNLNAEQTCKTVLQYYIAADTTEQARDLAILYYNYINKGGIVSDICEEDNSIEKEYLQELLLGQGTNYDSKLSSATMNIQIYGADEESCIKLANNVKKQVDIFQEKISEDICPHECILVDDAFSIYVDKNLTEAQMELQDQLENLQKNISDAKGKLSETQLLAAKTIIGSENNEIISKEDSSVSLSKKFIILGAAVGMLFAIVLIYMMYYFDHTLKNVSEFTGYYGIDCFGVIQTGRKNIWEKLADRIFYRQGEKGYGSNLIVPKICAICNNSGIHRIVFSVNQDVADEDQINTYAELLKKSGIETEIMGDIMNDPAAIQNLEINQNMILVEEIRKSGYEDVRKELLFCKEQGIRVLGCIAFSK